MQKQKSLIKIYDELLKKYSYQGWWPIKGKYHPKNYDFPKNEKQSFEIMIGAILTQNTSWKNAEKAIYLLSKKNLVTPKSLLDISHHKLSKLIISSGYHNQKARKLKEFSNFYLQNKNYLQKEKDYNKLREKLLSVWGIGKETADSILLYACKKPIFIVDTYTKRLFSSLLKINFPDYDSWQNFFHINLPLNYKLFNEFHALIVAEGKL
ncbi:hypothetical protein HYV50_02745 [Candidatus Pacearchaeota archaeon]|nr:hypothetical protein [Candidatus Pacearchaeota archaeon]